MKHEPKTKKFIAIIKKKNTCTSTAILLKITCTKIKITCTKITF